MNDKYFPYSYPCFSYCYDNKNCEAVTTKLEEEQPDWQDGEIMKEAFTNGGLKLLPEHKEFLKKYKKMLTKHIVPKGW